MTGKISRRHFLSSCAAAPLLASEAEPGERESRPPADLTPHVRVSCNLYSFNDVLRSGQMSLKEVIDFCSDLGFAAVDPTGYYFGSYPDVPAGSYTHEIKRHAFISGVDISGTGVRNDFTQSDERAVAEDVAHVKRWVPFASALGAPVLRVFAGRAVGAARERTAARNRLIDALRTCADYAGSHGVMIVLQNHADFLETADQVIDILEVVDSDWLGLNLDIGSFPTDDPYDDIARAAPYAVTWQIKENVHRGGRQEPTDLGRIARIVRDSGYRGYLPLETLGEGDPRDKILRFLNRVRNAFA